MKSNIFYKSSVERDLKKIDHKERTKITDEIEKELSSNPRAGIPLTGIFKGLFRYRIGDYRVVYTIIPTGILVLRMKHRKDVYR